MHRIARLDYNIYKRLHVVCGELQQSLGHRVSVSEAVDFLLCSKAGRTREFWRRIREKKLAGKAGRGKKRNLRQFEKNAGKVHKLVNSSQLRPEVS